MGPILLVEDEDGLRDSIQWLLEDEGWQVAVAADGRQALEQAEAERPSLVVLDMGLPVLGGDTVADGLQDLYAGSVPPILLITADGRAAAKARRVGAYGYLSKPFDFGEFVEAIHRGLRVAS